ncbi:Integrase catalytic domain-containing protein [Favolaschia claudopus]|uniref:Integrase catalytic domain-containing protein n=1 Tax=Favolaschia claudopus TaxID=2862362 RepID=A0AAV9Z1S1_9AGAR
MSTLLEELPGLPAHFDGEVWSPNVTQGYHILQNGYKYAYEALNAGDNDTHRLRLHSEKLLNRLFPILDAMEAEVLNSDWIETCAVALAGLILELEDSAAAIANVNAPRLKRPTIVQVQHTGRRGRPRKVSSAEWLEAAVAPGRRITLTKLAALAGVHRHTLRAYLIKYGVYERFCNISDHDLDLLVKTFKSAKPTSGVSYVIAFLRRHGLKIQKRRVHGSMRRIDHLGSMYSVPHSNYLWHLDGHHKLIRWGIVIHGIVDGYCRTVVGLHASTNNRASTVLDLFLRAVRKYGTPFRMRGDRGGENIEVSVWMIKHRGARRASFMWGSSTRNTRIERLWVEHTSMHHLWLLHRLFLDYINSDCHDFEATWNLHPLSGTRNKTNPHCETEHGPGVHPSILEEYYATEDALDSDWDNIDDMIAAPFSAALEKVFWEALEFVKAENMIPEDFDTDLDSYPVRESIHLGRGGKRISVTLPLDIWWPRALLWAQALDLMTRLLVENEL